MALLVINCSAGPIVYDPALYTFLAVNSEGYQPGINNVGEIVYQKFTLSAWERIFQTSAVTSPQPPTNGTLDVRTLAILVRLLFTARHLISLGVFSRPFGVGWITEGRPALTIPAKSHTR
jgi:hypothetical protein